MASSKGEKIGRLIVYDAMAAPGQRITLIADLVEEGLLGTQPLGGELIEFQSGERWTARTMSGGDGRAATEFASSAIGMAAVAVRLVDTRRVTAPDATARVFVWHRRAFLVIVDLAALVTPSREPDFGLPLPAPRQALSDPEHGAVEMLLKVARRARVLYVTQSDRLELSGHREWTEKHRLPPGPIFLLKTAPVKLARELEGWRREGWTRIKGGLVASPDEAKALVGKGLRAVVSPVAPSKETWPAKAIRPKNWAEVAEKLLA